MTINPSNVGAVPTSFVCVDFVVSVGRGGGATTLDLSSWSFRTVLAIVFNRPKMFDGRAGKCKFATQNDPVLQDVVVVVVLFDDDENDVNVCTEPSNSLVVVNSSCRPFEEEEEEVESFVAFVGDAVVVVAAAAAVVN